VFKKLLLITMTSAALLAVDDWRYAPSDTLILDIISPQLNLRDRAVLLTLTIVEPPNKVRSLVSLADSYLAAGDTMAVGNILEYALEWLKKSDGIYTDDVIQDMIVLYLKLDDKTYITDLIQLIGRHEAFSKTISLSFGYAVEGGTEDLRSFIYDMFIDDYYIRDKLSTQDLKGISYNLVKIGKIDDALTITGSIRSGSDKQDSYLKNSQFLLDKGEESLSQKFAKFLDPYTLLKYKSVVIAKRYRDGRKIEANNMLARTIEESLTASLDYAYHAFWISDLVANLISCNELEKAFEVNQYFSKGAPISEMGFKDIAKAAFLEGNKELGNRALNLANEDAFGATLFSKNISFKFVEKEKIRESKEWLRIAANHCRNMEDTKRKIRYFSMIARDAALVNDTLLTNTILEEVIDLIHNKSPLIPDSYFIYELISTAERVGSENIIWEICQESSSLPPVEYALSLGQCAEYFLENDAISRHVPYCIQQLETIKRRVNSDMERVLITWMLEYIHNIQKGLNVDVKSVADYRKTIRFLETVNETSTRDSLCQIIGQLFFEDGEFQLADYIIKNISTQNKRDLIRWQLVVGGLTPWIEGEIKVDSNLVIVLTFIDEFENKDFTTESYMRLSQIPVDFDLNYLSENVRYWDEQRTALIEYKRGLSEPSQDSDIVQIWSHNQESFEQRESITDRVSDLNCSRSVSEMRTSLEAYGGAKEFGVDWGSTDDVKHELIYIGDDGSSTNYYAVWRTFPPSEYGGCHACGSSISVFTLSRGDDIFLIDRQFINWAHMGTWGGGPRAITTMPIGEDRTGLIVHEGDGGQGSFYETISIYCLIQGDLKLIFEEGVSEMHESSAFGSNSTSSITYFPNNMYQITVEKSGVVQVDEMQGSPKILFYPTYNYEFKGQEYVRIYED
jgi:hypothetical protein